MAISLKRKKMVAGEGGQAPVTVERRKKKTRIRKPSKTSAKKKCFVLIVGDEGAILVFMEGNKVVRRLFAPSANPSHSEAITELMKANPNVPVSLLVDVIDQQYVPQNFPPVAKMSVGGLVKRRLERDFQAEDLKGALPLGRDKTGRKEWKFLLVSLAKTPLISEWLDILVELPNEMKGVYLVPIEANNYVQMIERSESTEEPMPWQLLISHNKVSGFRQVVMHHEKLVFTRVSQAIDDTVPAVIAGNIEQEIINTIEYLKRLEFRDVAELEATVVVSNDVIDSLDLNRFGFGRSRALSPIVVSELLGMEQAALSADRFGDVVIAAAFGIGKKRTLRFATVYLDKLSMLYKARQGIILGAALLVLLFTGLMVMTTVDIVGNMSELSTMEGKSRGTKNEVEKLRRTVDGLNQDVAFKSAVVAARDAYIKDMPEPLELMAKLAPLSSLTSRMVNLEWSTPVLDKNSGQGTPGTPPKDPVTVNLDVDFALAGGTIELSEKGANEFTASLKKALPEYTVEVQPFPWVKEEGGGDAAIDLNNTGSTAVTNAVVKYTLKGPHKVEGVPASAPSVSASAVSSPVAAPAVASAVTAPAASSPVPAPATVSTEQRGTLLIAPGLPGSGKPLPGGAR